MLKWRLQSRDEALVPLTINAWPSLSGAESFVNLEYEAAQGTELRNVKVRCMASLGGGRGRVGGRAGGHPAARVTRD